MGLVAFIELWGEHERLSRTAGVYVRDLATQILDVDIERGDVVLVVADTREVPVVRQV